MEDRKTKIFHYVVIVFFTMCFILTFIIFIAQAILAIKIIQNPEVIGEWIGKIFDGIGG